MEASFRTLKRFEKKLRFRIRSGQRPTLPELNEWLYEFLADVNNDATKGKENMSRNELWTGKVDSLMLKSPPPFSDFLKMAYESHDTRKIDSFCEISWRGKKYHLAHLEDLIGCNVPVYCALKESAIYVEYLDDMYGPFYPGRNEVQIGQYRSSPLTRFERTKRELKEVAEKLIGTPKDYGFEDPTYVRQDNYPNRGIPVEPIEADGKVVNARKPLQQEFSLNEAMLYVAMNAGFYWEDVPEELKGFVSMHFEKIYLKDGYIARQYLEQFLSKFEPVMEKHGLFENNF